MLVKPNPPSSVFRLGELDRPNQGFRTLVKGGRKDLLKKSVAVNPGEMRACNVVESREVTLSGGKIVQTLRQ